jgi:PKD repeat protein
VTDQFPIDPASIQTRNGGLGDDWTVALLFQNTIGEFAYLKYGFFQLGFFTPSAGEQTRVTGFGADSGTLNQVQQTQDGPYFGTSGTSLRYTLDTTGGNSGSPVIHEATQTSIGIHTNGGCSSFGYNSGSGNLNTAFQNAYNSVCVTPTVPVAAFSAAPTVLVAGGAVSFTDQSTGVPSSWAWDFDGDGLTDSAARNPMFVYAVAGVYDVKLTVTNALGSDTHTQPGLITANPMQPARPPYSQDFGGGLPGTGEWTFQSSGPTGAIVAGGWGPGSPVSGDPALTMAVTTSGTYVTNDSTLHLDVGSTTGARLTFWFKQTNEEDDPEDGVFLSDGTNEFRALSFNGGPSTWTSYALDLDALAAQGGVAFDEDFRVIFRQRDNYVLGTDGILIDDVVVTPDQALLATPDTLSLATGGAQTLTIASTPATAGLTYFVLGSFSGTAPGVSAFGLTLPLNIDPYFNALAANPGAIVAGSLGTLDSLGTATATVTLPAGSDPSLAGAVVHHAYLVLDPLLPSGVLAASNAAPLTLAP